MLGHRKTGPGMSFLVGYGDDYPRNPHHKAAACASPPAQCTWGTFGDTSTDNPHTLYGALVGGPKAANDVYVDDRNDYVMAEVTLDYNAGFQGAVAGLATGLCGSESSESSSTSSGTGEENENENENEELCSDPSGFYPHETDCQKYYQCAAGTPYEYTCAEGTLYSVDLKYCDWEANVECNLGATQPPTEPPTNNNTEGK